MQAPESRDSLRVHQFEYTLFTIRPFDVAGAVLLVLEQFQQELPQVRRRSYVLLR